MKGLLVATPLIWLAAIGGAAGQADQAASVLDRIVAPQSNGGPYVLTPPALDWSDGAVLAVGSAAKTIVGFEAAPEVKRVGEVATAQIAAVIKTRSRISLAGKTVREALDTIVAIDPRYRWVDIHGVPVVRPWASWTDPKHPLNQVVAPVAWPETDLASALDQVVALMTRTRVAGPVPGAGRGPTFAVQTGPIAIMELLNTIAVAHGTARWYMRHNCTTVDSRATYLHFEAVDGNQPQGLGICRVTSRNP